MYCALYSPLEQFEPIPLLIVFIGGIDFSITNVSIIFFYIVLFSWVLHQGYLYEFHDKKFVKFDDAKGKPIGSSYGSVFNEKAYFKQIGMGKLNFTPFFKYKSVPYLIFLRDMYSGVVHITNTKETWLGLNRLSLPSLKSEYSRELHKTYFGLISAKDMNFSSDFVFFNGIGLYFSTFLNNLSVYIKDISNNILLKDFSETFGVPYFVYRYRPFWKKFIPKWNLYIFEVIYKIILGMVKENIGGSRRRAAGFFPFVFLLFTFILVANLIGLVPYSSTVTSYLIITFAMALMVLTGVNIIAGRLHGLVYFGHFLPAGCPFALYPLIIPIEFISYVFRVVSLSVRLFANMMAGHTLLAVLAGFGWTMANASVSLCTFHFLPILVVFVLVFLETAVAIIQAYVFAILTCMYLDEAINLH